MPPWTLGELQLARPYAEDPVSVDALEERYSFWGGSVRYCLSPAAEFGEVRLAAAIRRVNVDNLFTLLDRVDSTPVRQISLVSKRHCNLPK